jgi:hypothetical protein
LVLRDKTRQQYSDDSSDDDADAVEESSAIPARQAQFTVRLLLDFLPPDQLEVFSWQNWEPLSVENFAILLRKQRKLRVLEIGPMDKDLEPLLEKNPALFDNLTELQSVDAYPDAGDRLRATQRLLKAKPNIQHLTVSSGYEYSPVRRPISDHCLETNLAQNDVLVANVP